MIDEGEFWALMELTLDGDAQGVRDWMERVGGTYDSEVQIFLTLPRLVAAIWMQGPPPPGSEWVRFEVDPGVGPEGVRAADMVSAAMNDDSAGLAGYVAATMASPPEFIGGVLAGLVIAMHAGMGRLPNSD